MKIPLFAPLVLLAATFAQAETRPPNVVYLMSDELAYYELSHMGNRRIHTPHIDQMAAEGLRFTQALAGAPVCAPLRCSLMTGKHMGHASVRANDGGTPLRAGEKTIASLLKARGYATGGFGKWGAGGRGSTGVPEVHGFDVFFGYYDQVHAHSYYPPYLIRNSQEVALAGNVGGRTGETYAHYRIMQEAVQFIRKHQDQPFFCYLPITPPHGMYDIPIDDPAWKSYANDPWMQNPDISQEAKNYAAMVTMVDNNLAQILALLKELHLENDTIVFFTGDNGGQDRFKDKEYPRGFFGPNVNPINGVEFRGGKGSLYEGGLRIPFLVRWPGKIEAGKVSDLLCYQPDILPTLTELCKAETPPDVDGISILPEILGADAVGHSQAQHEFLYWEFGQQVAVRIGNWKGIRPGTKAAWELYDLTTDISESVNVAKDHPEMLARMQAYATQAHSPVRPGTYQDRSLHERDRQAKFGFAMSNRSSAGKLKTEHRLSHEQLLASDTLRVASCSSENTGNDRLAAYAVDGDPQTIWHTQFSPTLVQPPHELVIDLGKPTQIVGVQYLARQDGGWNGTFGATEFYAGDSLEDVQALLGKHTFAKQKAVQTVKFERPVSARFVKVRILSEINGGPWASAADIGVLVKTD
jgi:arylsulfatase A-like enzyme